MNSTTVECAIEGFSVRGFGLGSHPSGQSKVEVAHAIPGDRVRVELMRKRHRVKKGRLLELLMPSLDRIEPRCQHASICGGCSWALMAYEAQVTHKQALIHRAFGDLIHANVEVLPMVRCEDPWAYRNKMEFSFSENRAGTRFLGLMIAHAEPYVFNVEHCEIAPSWMSECLSRIRDWWDSSGLIAYYPPQDRGTLRYLTLREAVNTGQKMVVLNISGNLEFALSKEQVQSFIQTIGEGPAIFLRIHHTKKGTPTHFREEHLAGPDHLIEELHLQQGALRFKISPSSFFQPNTKQAEKLYDQAMIMLGKGHELVYDLYCGTGTLAMAAAAHAKQIIGVELNADAVCDAKENACMNGLSNLQFYQGDVGTVLKMLVSPDALIVDPPRAGLDERALQHLKTLSPRKIVYLSCNPLTQAENIRILLSSGYFLVQMCAVDQFPHTAHIENIALLSKRC